MNKLKRLSNYLNYQSINKIMNEIRYASKEDLDLIIKGILEICNLEKEKPDTKKQILRKTLKAIKNKEIITIYTNNKPVAFIQFKFTKKTPYGINYSDNKNKLCWIDWIYVLKGYRKKGLGNRLLKDLEYICKQNKTKEIMLDVFKINKSATKFYEHKKYSEYIKILREKIN